MSRPTRITVAVALLLVSWTTLAMAARIDAELKRVMQDKARAEIIPVLMVFPADLEFDDLEVQLDGATPTKRRKSALAALKRMARKSQADAWEIIEDPDLPGVLLYAEMLYINNAITFAADTDAIEAIAEAGEGENKSAAEAVLFYDKDVALLADAARAPAGDEAKSARADTTWNLDYVRAPEVWRDLGYTGQGILIGHIDTGVDLDHPDLKYRIAINPQEIADNGLDDDGNGLVDDVLGWDFGDGDAVPQDDAQVNSGHGTHTAGTIVGDGSAGVQTGAAPGASLVPVKIFTSSGNSSLGRIWAAQQYCIERGCRIISMSVGLKGQIPAAYLRNDRLGAAGLRAAGVIVFNSAGNEHDTYDPPHELGMTARIPAPWSALDVPALSTGGVITVGATGDRTHEIYPRSSQGPAAWDQVEPWHDWPYMPGPGLIKPDVVAPGVNIRSTQPRPQMYSGENWSGTSMATPLVAGIAALMLEKNPTLSPAGVDSLLELTARDLGVMGKDVVYGSGLVDAYAAVAAVPADLLPNIASAEFLPDPFGNARLDRGELADVVFSVYNAGWVQATGVIGRLTVTPDPYVSVISGTAAFGVINAASLGANALEPFRLAVSPLAPHGHRFGMTLSISTAEGFERAFDVESYVGLPEYRTHDAGDLYLTVTAHGSLGYVSDARQYGAGIGLGDGASQLFVGSFWAGGSVAGICNNDLTGGGTDPAEWRPRLDPTGHVAQVEDLGPAQAFSLAFTDSGHAAPDGIEVTLTSRAWADPERREVVQLDYLITNTGSRYYAAYHAGLFLDFDVLDALGNVGGTDPAARAAWVGMPDGPVYGVAAIGDAPVSNVTVIDNVQYVYPFSRVLEQHKFQLLNGTLHTDAIETPTDLSALVAFGPLDLDPGDQARVTVLVAYGATRERFLANVVAAGGHAPYTGVAEPTIPRSDLTLAQNVPNPFNPVTTIRFTLPARDAVSLAVYDLAGRRVRSLVQGDLAAGAHAVRWDGRNERGDQAASGIYLYRLTTSAGERSRKMMLVK